MEKITKKTESTETKKNEPTKTKKVETSKPKTTKCEPTKEVVLPKKPVLCTQDVKTNACSSIMESIAKEEEAVAAIMKAEAIKIRRVTKYTKSIPAIKEINESARKTIQELIKLNIVLQLKLETVKEFEC